MKTIIIWYRNDLRVHDHPALSRAIADANKVVPVFILNDRLLHGQHSSSNRNRFLLECLQDLKTSLLKRGANLVIRSGDATTELKKLAKEVSADAIYYTADYTPFALHRDKAVKQPMTKDNIEFHGFGGRLAVDHLDGLATKAGTPHKVFTPFWKQWLGVQRREVVPLPKTISFPAKVTLGTIPKLDTVTNKKELSPDVAPGGETEGRKRLKAWLDKGIEGYHQGQNDMAADDTSRLSPYLHLGCLSVREIETILPDSKGARAWHRQLCWREFYHYILYKNPGNAKQEFQEKYRKLTWDKSEKLLEAWQNGQTGYPVVDAGMRQLLAEGWMHNRARLIVGSFLTKDLWLDWRLGETHFMRWLIDGDEANNNGNWQWIASVGVDPAPVYRRLYNPTSQQQKFDPTGAYTRKYVPELAKVPDEFIAEPWKMSDEQQQKYGCVLGTDYPAPIVDHKAARLAALEQYRSVN